MEADEPQPLSETANILMPGAGRIIAPHASPAAGIFAVLTQSASTFAESLRTRTDV